MIDGYKWLRGGIAKDRGLPEWTTSQAESRNGSGGRRCLGTARPMDETTEPQGCVGQRATRDAE